MSKEFDIEVKEAKDVLNSVLNDINIALKYYRSAKNWGLFDLVGGGFITSMVKRNKIEKGNLACERIKANMGRLNKELRDIGYLGDLGIENGLVDNFFDVYFDNIFTDYQVQNQIGNIIGDLENFEDKLIKINKKLGNL